MASANSIGIPISLVHNDPHSRQALAHEHTSDDCQLMQAVSSGDHAALAVLIDRWKQPLMAYLYKACGSYSDAEDLAQLTFISLYKAAHRYQPTAKFSTYLFHIARSRLLNHFRTQRRKPATPTAPEDMPQAVTNPKEQEHLRDYEEIFQQALLALPEKQRTALLLLKQQELSYEEIAQSMDASIGAVKTWLHRARETLKNHFNTIQ